MNIQLNPLEVRVIGCLIEKQITTPDQYPLSLNALLNACNQKSNRDPVLQLDEEAVQRTVDALVKRHFVVERSGFGSRVPKYQQRFCNSEFGSLKLDPQELAVLCELMVRGPQTPGELRGRASRMASFAEVSEVEAALARLSSREDGPFVTRLAREPGRRDSCYAHLLGGAVATAEGNPSNTRDIVVEAQATNSHMGAQNSASDLVQHDLAGRATVSAPEVLFPASRNEERLSRLEQEVQSLRAELNDLRTRLGG